MKSTKWLIALLLAATASPAFAWGTLGHRIVAETAALLIARDTPGNPWGPILARHRFELGYYSMIPDLAFRGEDGNHGHTEGPTHFFDLDLALGALSPKAANVDLLPHSYADLRSRLEPKLGKNGFEKLGSGPWRAEQFTDIAWKRFHSIQALKGGYQRGSESRGEEKKLYEGLLDLGLLSHYSGDASMPYHATSDFNGWKTGEGGIHYYFENDCVSELEPGLSVDVLASARKHRKAWLARWGALKEQPAGFILHVYQDSAREIAKISKVDREEVILKRSSPDQKNPAVRRPAAQACPAFRKLLVESLARGAVATAYLWDIALPRKADLRGAAQLQFSDLIAAPKYIAPAYDLGWGPAQE